MQKVVFRLFPLIILGGILYYVSENIQCSNDSYATKGTTFSIMTFNLNAGDSLNFLPQKQANLKKIIEKEHPSILCLQELSFKNHEKIRNYLDSIFGKCEVLNSADHKWRFLFYSRFPIRNFQRLNCRGSIDTTDFDKKLLDEYKIIRSQIPMMSAEFEVAPNKWITIFSGHLRSSAYSTARRSMGENTMWCAGIPLYWHNYLIGKRIRDYEAQNIRRYVDYALRQNKKTFVVGDLNDWCGSNCLDILMGYGKEDKSLMLKDAWQEGGSGMGFTYYGWHLRLRLDHILYSNNVLLENVKVVDSNMSDHKPLIAKFWIN